jgi:1,4-dihydroxy-6-naphthoate synthase
MISSLHQTHFSLGFSPCPNDTFMFDAMVHGKIDTEGLTFNAVLEDVETLNRNAESNVLDISKVSFAAFTHLTDKYQLLNSGAALGNGVGPLLISLREVIDLEDPNITIAIPGKNTTANFLFSLFFPKAKNKIEMVFSEIENAVLSGKVDAGVIIHENRFTYAAKGLKKLFDLGQLWEKQTGKPIPLGGIVVRKTFNSDIREKIDRIVRRSVEFAFANRDSSADYVREYSQEMESHVIQQHIETYVNDFSVDLGDKGREAIYTLFEKSINAGMISYMPAAIFAAPSVSNFKTKDFHL